MHLRITDDPDPATIGRRGVITDVVWEEGRETPTFIVTCIDGQKHLCGAPALRLDDSAG
jgi:hypothetical protein